MYALNASQLRRARHLRYHTKHPQFQRRVLNCFEARCRSHSSSSRKYLFWPSWCRYFACTCSIPFRFCLGRRRSEAIRPATRATARCHGQPSWTPQCGPSITENSPPLRYNWVAISKIATEIWLSTNYTIYACLGRAGKTLQGSIGCLAGVGDKSRQIYERHRWQKSRWRWRVSVTN